MNGLAQFHKLVDAIVEFPVKYVQDTVVATSVLTRYYVKSENQLLLCENLGWKNDLYLILKP